MTGPTGAIKGRHFGGNKCVFSKIGRPTRVGRAKSRYFSAIRFQTVRDFRECALHFFFFVINFRTRRRLCRRQNSSGTGDKNRSETENKTSGTGMFATRSPNRVTPDTRAIT